VTVLAHIAGMPLEEALLSLGPVGATLAVARAWLAVRRLRVQ
jgi:hypothetical protein